jgi:hypothetical protein
LKPGQGFALWASPVSFQNSWKGFVNHFSSDFLKAFDWGRPTPRWRSAMNATAMYAFAQSVKALLSRYFYRASNDLGTSARGPSPPLRTRELEISVKFSAVYETDAQPTHLPARRRKVRKNALETRHPGSSHAERKKERPVLHYYEFLHVLCYLGLATLYLGLATLALVRYFSAWG